MNLALACQTPLFLWLVCLQTVFSHSYTTSHETDLTDAFRARGVAKPAYSEFAPIHTPVKHDSDHFYGKAHDTPAVSNFKSDQPKVKVEDGFRGSASRVHEHSYEEEHGKIVSEPIPNLIHDKAASIYVEPEKVKIVKEPYESDSAYQKEKQYEYPVDDHGHDTHVDQGSNEAYHPQPDHDVDVYEKLEQPEKVPEVPIISVYHPIAPTTNRLKPSVKPVKSISTEPNTYYFITKPPSTAAQNPHASNSDRWEAVQFEHYDGVTVPPPKYVNRSSEASQQSPQGSHKPITTRNKTGVVFPPKYPLGVLPERVTIPPIIRQNSSVGTPQVSYKPIVSEKKPEIVSLPSVSRPVVQQGPASSNSMSDRYIMAIPFQNPRRPQQEKKRPSYVDFNPPGNQHVVLPPSRAPERPTTTSAPYTTRRTTLPTKYGPTQKFTRPTETVTITTEKSATVKQYEQWIKVTRPPPPVITTGARYVVITTTPPHLSTQHVVSPPSRAPDRSTTTSAPHTTRPITPPTKYGRTQKFTPPTETVTSTTEKSTTVKQYEPTPSAEPVTSTDDYVDQTVTVITNYNPTADDPQPTDENPQSLEQDQQNTHIEVDPKCQGIAEGVNVSVANCRRYYVQCIQGKAQQRHCHNAKDVFSERHDGCVSKLVASECKTKAKIELDSSAIFENDGNYCSDHPDGFYQHPKNCSRIVQCFGGEIFEYPPCDRGLAFDEQQGVCNYRDQVEGCSAPDQDEIGFDQTLTGDPAALKAGGCGGHNHGDHVADQTNCSQYLRCVWGQLVTMNCPDNTVFNPKLDVCDFPDQVPECKNNVKQ
ncbi:chitin binding peritrophin-A domain-containing protein [Ditylenchus destructor]|nr:chitin binding peritrophin-A domain-containing protein [Ditylenchus destructor]